MLRFFFCLSHRVIEVSRESNGSETFAYWSIPTFQNDGGHGIARLLSSANVTPLIRSFDKTQVLVSQAGRGGHLKHSFKYQRFNFVAFLIDVRDRIPRRFQVRHLEFFLYELMVLPNSLM